MRFSPANLNILGYELDFNLTAGVILWPVVFITTDIINEYFGKQGVKKITYFTVLLISYTFIVISLVTFLSPASFWLDINNIDDKGKPFDISYIFIIDKTLSATLDSRWLINKDIFIIVGKIFI